MTWQQQQVVQRKFVERPARDLLVEKSKRTAIVCYEPKVHCERTKHADGAGRARTTAARPALQTLRRQADWNAVYICCEHLRAASLPQSHIEQP
jgi:hypothetical protein